MSNDISFTVFYCWQSDLRSACNRTFIQNALESAITELNQDASLFYNVGIDQDTLNVSGSPKIDDTILSKIDNSHAFVADVSLVNSTVSDVRPSPNPNVLFEFGFALHSMGWERIVLVMNTAFGGPEQLPFDLRNRRVLTYNSPAEAPERATERRGLSRELQKAIGSIIVKHPLFPPAPGDPVLSEKAFQVLKNAVETGQGVVLLAERWNGAMELQIGNLRLDFPSRREAKDWELAIDDLGKCGLLKSINESVFQVTARGYQHWDKIARRLS